MRVIELFAGIGACSKALRRLGIDVEIVDAVEIDKYAIKSFNAVHGTNFDVQDIKEWDKDFDNIDLITHGSPCFLAGEKVNTKNGFKNIENINIGDYVKSHDGSYNKVIKKMKNKNNIIYDICCSATHNINTTYNHPFYVLRENNLKWLKANELTTKDFMCIPKNKCQNEIDNNNSTLPLKNIRFWYLIGRFIGDGWVTKRKERNYNISGIKICCAKEELEDLENKLCNILHYCVVEDKSTYKLQFTNKELGQFCSEFGIGAKNKHIPQWVLDLKTEYLKYLLMGILESDGCYSQNRYKVTTTSRDLAYNVGELVLKVKNVPYHIYKTIRPTTHKIEGRIVNQNNTYQITWSNIYNKNINFVDDDYLYSRVRKINSREEENDVYNIEVKNTHTYCINNIAVHNCQDFSLAGKQAGGDKDSGTRSSLMYETIRIVEKLKPRYVIWENVKNLLSKKHRHNFDAYLDTMKELGYTSYYQVLNAKDYGIPQNRERVFTVSILGNDNYEFPKGDSCSNKIDMVEIPQKVKVRKYEVDIGKLKNVLRSHKNISNKLIAESLNKPLTLVEHWFRKDDCFSIPDADIWFSLKELLNIETNEFDEKITTFEEKDNIYEKSNRFYYDTGLAPTITSTSANEKIIETFTFPPKQPLKLKLKDMLEDEVDEKYYLSEDIIQKYIPVNETGNVIGKLNINKWQDHMKRIYNINKYSPTISTMQGGNLEPKVIIGSTQKHAAISTNGIVPTLTSAMGQGGGHVPMHNYDLRIRKLTPKECWRLMGFDDEDFEKAEKVNSNTQLYKQAGNSIVVNVLEKIFENLF